MPDPVSLTTPTSDKRAWDHDPPPRSPGVAPPATKPADDHAGAGTIHDMPKEHLVPRTGTPPTAALPRDQSRLEMMRRVKRMSVEQRVDLFERLSRDAAWARSATRIR
jgi:hypothetical protein